MQSSRFKIIEKKLSYYLEEVQALRNGGVSYFIGFGILLTLLFPILILELAIVLVIGKDLGWFQSSEHVDEVMKMNADEVPEDLHDLIPLAKKWGIGDDFERGEFMRSATSKELDELEEKVGSKMQKIGDWLSSYPEDYLRDTTYLFTCLVSAYDECDSYKKGHNAREAHQKSPAEKNQAGL